MYVPAPLPVSLSAVNANCMKHEVKTGSKTCPPPPLLLLPSTKLERKKSATISWNRKLFWRHLLKFIGWQWQLEKCRSNCVCQSKYFKLKRGSYYLTTTIDNIIFYYYMVVRYCYYHSILFQLLWKNWN